MSLSYFKNIFQNSRSGFTMLELIVVMGIIAILGTISVVVLNPAQMFKQTRDANRITDIQNINQALVYYRAGGGSSFGSANTIYISLPSDQSDCSDLGLPDAPLGWSYACQPEVSYKNSDGTGWVPVDFTTVQQTVGTLFTNLPVDPVNTLSGDYYYTYIVGSWTLSATMESTKYINSSAADDGGVVSTRFEAGNELTLNSNITAGGGLSNAKAITGFSFASPAATGVVTELDHTIAVTVPNGTIVTALVPTITISALASVSPNTGVAQDFTSPVTYTVTAENATTQDYVVTVTEEPPAFAATGGTITTSGGYTIHTFTTSGTFTVTDGSGDVEVLVVAGGGGGGATIAGGGGGGGLIYDSAHAVTAQAYTVTVGDGGGAGPAPYGAGLKGGNSVFSTLTAIGGGGGAAYSASPVGTGGSAGGNGAVGVRAGYTAGQGNDGGAGDGAGSYAGGGGGAGAVGSSAQVGVRSGNGGVGLAYSISGVSTYYAGGGGGGSRWTSGGPAGTGGNGGGGNGRTDAAGNPGTANTGGGGGGGAYYGTEKAGGAGGSGIVIIRYLTP